MNTTSDELLAIARRCADKLTLSKRRPLPSLEDLEDVCEEGIEELLAVLQDEDVIGEVDLAEQQTLVDRIEASLPETRRALMTELTDMHTREVWLQQEAAYHLGVAVGMKLASARIEGAPEQEGEADDTTEE